MIFEFTKKKIIISLSLTFLSEIVLRFDGNWNHRKITFFIDFNVLETIHIEKHKQIQDIFCFFFFLKTNLFFLGGLIDCQILLSLLTSKFKLSAKKSHFTKKLPY